MSRVSASTKYEPPSGSAVFATPLSCAMICWVLSASVAASLVGSASASSSELVCSELVPPSTAESAYRFQQALERKEKIVVGVNDFVQEHEEPIETLYIDEAAGKTQLDKLDRLRKTRDADRVRLTLDRLRGAARTTENVMPPILDAVRAYATLGEMCDALREVWGEYEEVPII